MEIILRQYQEEMISTAMVALKKDNFVLLQGSTGCGKTIFFSELIKRLLHGWPELRIAVLAHRRELIQQAQDKLLQVWFNAPIGIACASTGNKSETDMPITIGSIQTLANKVNTTAPFDLIIIDEVHRLPPQSTTSQYGKWIEAMMEYNPSARILGVTATPFRLGHGHIYGKGCKPDAVNWFPTLSYKVGIKDLQRQGFLCGYRAKAVVDVSTDLKNISLSGGDYNLGALSDMMSKEIHVGSAVKAYQQYGEDRKHTVVFAVTIDHAEKLKDAFHEAGFKAMVVHSKMTMQQRDMALKAFEDGEVQFIVNVGILTEGWDSTAVDCLILCRPTKSPALFVQMTGRGLRLHPGKKDVLILDMANNCQNHGDPDNPIIDIPQRKSAIEGSTAPSTKQCPNCKEVVAVGSMECPECGYIWEKDVVEVNKSVKMREIDFKKPIPIPFNVENATIEKYTSKKGNTMCRLTLTDYSNMIPRYVNEYWCFDPDAHEYARKKARIAWKTLTDTTPPNSTDEALERDNEIWMHLPDQIEVTKDGDFLKVHNWRPNMENNSRHIQPQEYTQAELNDVPF